MTDNTSQAHTVTVIAATPDDWERTRALRLAALADTPDAFAATPDRTSALYWAATRP